MDRLSDDLASLRISREDVNRPSRARRVLLGLVILAALTGAIYVAVGRLGARVFKAEVELTRISMLSPVQASIQVTSTGYVIPQSQTRVAAKTAGRLAEVRVKEGDVVKVGDVIAILADDDQRSALAAADSRILVARANIETARANLAEIQSQVARTRRLVEARAVPPATLDDLEARARVLAEMVSAAEAESVAARAETRTMKVALNDRTIVAPIAGTVISKPLAVGEMVGPAVPITEVADFDSLMVETDVPEARLAQVSPGTNCEIVLDAYPSKRYRGITTEIGKRVNRAKATVVAKVKFVDTVEGVLPEMSARVSFLNAEISKESLTEKPKKVVAADAVAQRQGRSVLFVVEEDTLKIVPVTTGQTMGSQIELVDGPAPDMRVVARPSAELFDGQKIKERQN